MNTYTSISINMTTGEKTIRQVEKTKPSAQHQRAVRASKIADARRQAMKRRGW